jgi:hypothetical protein
MDSVDVGNAADVVGDVEGVGADDETDGDVSRIARRTCSVIQFSSVGGSVERRYVKILRLHSHVRVCDSRTYEFVVLIILLF